MEPTWANRTFLKQPRHQEPKEKAKFSCIEPQNTLRLLSTCFQNTYLPYEKKRKQRVIENLDNLIP